MKREIDKMGNLPDRQLPGVIMEDLMGAIRNAFYAGDKRWFKEQHFIRSGVVAWPAGWLTERGLTLSPARYKGLVMDIIVGIKQHGDTENVRYWPRYLAHAVQEHFRIHEDEIYAEAKRFSGQIEDVLKNVARTQERSPDPIQIIAMARKLNKPKAPVKPNTEGQFKLL